MPEMNTAFAGRSSGMILSRIAVIAGALLLPTIASAQAKSEEAVGEKEARLFAQSLLELSIPALEGVLRGVAELANRQPDPFAELDVQPNSSKSIFV